MFPPRMFAPRYFAPRYFPPGAEGAVPAEAAAVTGGWWDYRPGERRKRGLEWDKPDPQELRRRLERIYASVTGEQAPVEVKAEAAQIVRPHLEASTDRAVPLPRQVDWPDLAKHAAAVDRLLALLDRIEAANQDEEEAIMLLLS